MKATFKIILILYICLSDYTLMAIVLSDALPIQFWPIAEPTFNEKINPFVDKRCYIHEWGVSDPIKLQISNEEDLSNEYGLILVDKDENIIAGKNFTATTVSAKNRFDLEFTFSEFDLPDQFVRFYIRLNPGTLDGDTLDSETLDTEDAGPNIYKSDFHYFNSNLTYNQAWGSRLAYYKSSKNFAGIKYPNNGNYFALRIPSRFYKPRNVKMTTQLGLSQSKIATTSIVSTYQQLLKISLLPQYMLDKIELILQHCVSDGGAEGGSVVIDGIEWQADESFDRADIDEKCAFDMASTWLSKGMIRNII